MAIVVGVLFLITCIFAISAGSNLRGEVTIERPEVTPQTPQFRVIPPVFTDPREKVASLNTSAFTERLYAQAIALDPAVGKFGTQVHLGFWSGIRSTGSNHGSLVRLLDSINSFNSDPTQVGPQVVQRAIWDEGVSSSNQYPLYVKQINEFWYERTTIPIVIRGKQYPKTHFVDFATADLIWGLYSQRFADLSTLIRKQTGRVPHAWCFVNGARSNRIFYAFELPQLIALEAAGDVVVFFAFTQESSWLTLGEWAQGTAQAPRPLPAGAGVGVRRLSYTTTTVNSKHRRQSIQTQRTLHHYYHYGPDRLYDDDDDDDTREKMEDSSDNWRELVSDRALLARQYKHHGLGKLLYDAVAVANLVRSINSRKNITGEAEEASTESFAVDLLVQYNPSFDREECGRAFAIGLEYSV